MLARTLLPQREISIRPQILPESGDFFWFNGAIMGGQFNIWVQCGKARGMAADWHMLGQDFT